MQLNKSVVQVFIERIGLCSAFVAVVLYSYFINKFSVNLPIWDDYQAVLEFLNKYHEAGDVQSKIGLIFHQHNEHRIVLVRLCALFMTSVFGHVSFPAMILFGNVGWLLVIVYLWRFAKSVGVRVYEFSPLVLLLLAFSHYELMVWGMASVQQYYQVLFALMTINFLIKDELIYASLGVLVSVFVGGGGLVLIPVLFTYLILKNRHKAIWFALFSAVLLYSYFVALGYAKPQGHPSILGAIKSPYSLFLYSLAFLGSAAGTIKIHSIALGGLVCLFFLKNAWLSYKKTPFLFWTFIFILATTGVTALTRSGFGVEQALSSRYTIYSVLFIAFIYLQFIVLCRASLKTTLFNVGLATAIVIFLGWLIFGVGQLQSRKEMLSSSGIYASDRHGAELILEKSFKYGFFSKWDGLVFVDDVHVMPKSDLESQYCLNFQEKVEVCNGIVRDFQTKQAVNKVLKISQDVDKIRISGWVVDSVNRNSACALYLEFGAVKRIVALNERADVAQALENPAYRHSGFDEKIDVKQLPSGTHHLILKTIGHSCDFSYETIQFPIVKE